ncbi:alpha-D-ribose 1-methylphosphonate 5-triphosphate diphosphatase [Tabrizicola sp.]|uniref:alpha-D-ribose 1-methylphosphonate 5-triphosphate diphosphatase n=1 Tax=Tabrizicola sp. TaxID=2005166 RepID=UPI003F3884D8
MTTGDPVIFEGASVILPGKIAQTSVRIADGHITGLDAPRDGARVIDASGLILAPALVDIHGDAFERQIMPRPGVTVPTEAAFLETDRQLAANGIATAYHALTLGWEPGLRSVETGWQVHDTLDRLAKRLTVENRLQLRWETFCIEAIPLIEAALAGPLTPSIAFNDHTSMALLHPETALQDRPFDHDPAFPVTNMDSPAFAAKMGERAKRSHMSTGDFVELIRTVWQRRPQVPAWIDDVAAKGRAVGAPMLSHDDSQEETRTYFRERGARITEFPMNRRTADFARAGGDHIVLGAPNAARGGSHLGSIAAADMIRAGLCDILASDYYYPAMLAAIARLRADDVAPLEALWPLVAAAPAHASGLSDRGTIAVGLRADLVVVDWPEGNLPAIRQTWVAGRCAYSAMPSAG